MPTLSVGGYDVGYIDQGQGDLVILAHCSLGVASLWRPVMDRLSDRWRCIAFDLPGHGASQRGDRSKWLQYQAIDYVIGLADFAGAEKAHLVGLSLGGAVSARAAHLHPERVRSLSLFEPIIFHFLDLWAPEEQAHDRKIMDPVFQACEEGRHHDGARMFMEGWGQPGQFDRMPGPAQDAIARALKFIARDFPLSGQWPEGQLTEDDIRAVDTPTLIAHGETTHNSAKVVNRGLHGLFPNSELHEIADAGHLSPVDQPDAVASQIARFLGSVEASELA
ncbi:MAG: alpha/beta hydrolase [Pseudomonadota bacterium]